VLPVLENPADDVLAKATTGTQAFDAHVNLYESVGTLISLVRDSNEQNTMLQAAFGPLVQELGVAVQKLKSGVRPELVEVLQVHHVIIAIGALARGFPEPGEVPPTSAPSWVAVFEQPSQAVLQALEAFKSWRIVRDAVSNAKAFHYANVVIYHSVATRHVRPWLESSRHWRIEERIWSRHW
jgi:exportin-T